MSEGRWDIPETWSWAKAEEFATVVGGGTPHNAKDDSNYAPDGMPWITPADLSDYRGTYIARGRRDLSEKGLMSSSARVMPKGTVLLSSRAPVGYCAVASGPISTNQGFKSFVFDDPALSPEYIRYYLLASKQYLESEASGTTFLEISGGRARDLLFPIAPSDEQKRIVSRIDEFFSSIDEGERALERVRKLVERYRQSVLKAAVTGELTREWREQHVGELEFGEALLTDILESRRKAWETSEVAKITAKKKRPVNGKWKQRYKEPVLPDIGGLPELPSRWAWASLEQLCFVETGSTPKRGASRYYKNGTVDWITSSAVNTSPITNAEEKITEIAVAETNAKVFPVGTLIVAMYGEGKTRGKIAELGIPAATNQACAGLLVQHLHPSLITYVRTFFEKNYEALRSKAAGGVQPNLNLTILKEALLPIPPFRELEQINHLTAAAMSQVASIHAELQPAGNRAIALKQAVLRQAFMGSLVPQDPTDEPASVLLERVAAHRAHVSSQPSDAKQEKSKSRFSSGAATRKTKTIRKGKAKA